MQCRTSASLCNSKLSSLCIYFLSLFSHKIILNFLLLKFILFISKCKINKILLSGYVTFWIKWYSETLNIEHTHLYIKFPKPSITMFITPKSPMANITKEVPTFTWLYLIYQGNYVVSLLRNKDCKFLS